MPRGAVLALAALTLLSGCMGAALTTPSQPAKPFSVVVYGDSFTAAWDPGHGDRRELSWASGSGPGMGSILQRLQAVDPQAALTNVAFGGARMRDIPAQAQKAKTAADLVLVWLGINDMCRGPSAASPENFRADVQASFALLQAVHPAARVVVLAIPDLWKLHELHGAKPEALALWGQVHDYCPEFFNPVPGPGAELIAGTRLDSMNEVLREEARHVGFDFSRATLWPAWQLSDFSDVDYFHPNVGGESRIAEAIWPIAQA